MQVKILSQQRGKDDADKTRAVMYKFMSNKLMTAFNMEGRGQKNKKALKDFPPILSIIMGKLRIFF
jgi:hypothetical protein